MIDFTSINNSSLESLGLEADGYRVISEGDIIDTVDAENAGWRAASLGTGWVPTTDGRREGEPLTGDVLLAYRYGYHVASLTMPVPANDYAYDPYGKDHDEALCFAEENKEYDAKFGVEELPAPKVMDC